MKNLIFLCLLILSAMNLTAQKSFVINESGGPSISCDNISINTETNIYEFSGNVNFKNKDISIEKAQKVTYDAKKRKVTASEMHKVTMMHEGQIVSFGNCKKGNLKYKLGSRRLVLNQHCE